MLCEGIMLYLLVVRVFGNAAQRWYWLLIVGWGKYNTSMVRVTLQSLRNTITRGAVQTIVVEYVSFWDNCTHNSTTLPYCDDISCCTAEGVHTQ